MKIRKKLKNNLKTWGKKFYFDVGEKKWQNLDGILFYVTG